MREVSLHLPAIAAAAAARFVISALWYSPVLFVKPWMSYTGVSQRQLAQKLGKGIPLDVLASILMAFAMAYIVGYAGAMGYDGGVSIAFLVWIGFVAAPSLSPTVYEGRPWGLWLLNNGCLLVSLMAMGGILASWHKS
jgi:hypothetical protein